MNHRPKPFRAQEEISGAIFRYWVTSSAVVGIKVRYTKLSGISIDEFKMPVRQKNIEESLPVRKELLLQKSTSELQAGLNLAEPVRYTENGNRSQPARSFLKKIKKTAERVGITRVADISFLSPIRFPVYQTSRPNLYAHSFFGQNTGGQGKGATADQARISAIMETIESYCVEPKHSILIRNSYDFLKSAHRPTDPGDFVLNLKNKQPEFDEPLIWTEGFSFWNQSHVLLPAEAVFFPFISSAYKTGYFFSQGSNGLASGATYLEATIHGLYELIERHYMYYFEKGLTDFEAIIDGDFSNIPYFSQIEKQTRGEFELQIYSVRLKETPNLPVVMSLLVGDDMHFKGWGCSGNIEISIHRAISESIQSLATFVSGSREDIDLRHGENEDVSHFQQPDFQSLDKARFQNLVINKKFKTLQDELKFITSWLKQIGFNKFYMANLSRVGLDVAVVKSFVPGLKLPERMRKVPDWDSGLSQSLQYNFPRTTP